MIEALAESVGDAETGRLACDNRREEQRLADFVERQIPALAKAAAREEIPAPQRRRSGDRSSSANHARESRGTPSDRERRRETRAEPGTPGEHEPAAPADAYTPGRAGAQDDIVAAVGEPTEATRAGWVSSRRTAGLRRRRLPPRLADGLAVGAMLLAALWVYLPYALNAGWYYDDWHFYSLFQDNPGGLGPDLSACSDHITGGRSAACLYHATEYNLLGTHRTGYHLVAIGFLVLVAGLGYAVLQRCRVPRPWATLAAVMLILFPASDSTRLWAVAAIGQYVLALVLAAQLLALIALERRRMASTVFHVLSAALALLAMITYEIAMPLIALSGLLYVAAYRERRVLWRGAFDLLLVLGFVIWRLAVSPPAQETGFVVERSVGKLIERAGRLLEGTWTTWKYVYAPGALGTAALVALAVTILVLSARESEFRDRVLPWVAGLGVAVLFLIASSLVFLTANDFYVPVLSSTFNRLNLPGSLPAACAFIAVLGLGYEAARRFVGIRHAAVAAVAVVALGIGWHQLGIATDHKQAWEGSWRLQEAALAGYGKALTDVPTRAHIVGFDTPLWEADFVPVFSATWDLRGAIDYTTAVDPSAATPWFPGSKCGADGITLAGASQGRYGDSARPLYFVSPRRGQALRVRSQGRCERVLERWGRSPFWAPDALN